MNEAPRGSRTVLKSGTPAPRTRPERSGPVRVELIAIGDDLLRGRVADGNSQSLAWFFTRRGARIARVTVVGDDEAAIAAAVREALDRNPHLVVTTGGLGPGAEDLTLAAVGETLGLPLSSNGEARSLVEAAYQRQRRRKLASRDGLTATREKMCRIPVGAIAVPNEVGVAPGVICHLPGGSSVLCLPGNPEELKSVLQAALLRLPEGTQGTRVHLAHREVEAPTADESALRPLLDRLAAEFPGVWIRSRTGGGKKRSEARIVISLEAMGATLPEATAAVDGVVRRLLALASGAL